MGHNGAYEDENAELEASFDPTPSHGWGGHKHGPFNGDRVHSSPERSELGLESTRVIGAGDDQLRAGGRGSEWGSFRTMTKELSATRVERIQLRCVAIIHRAYFPLLTALQRLSKLMGKGGGGRTHSPGVYDSLLLLNTSSSLQYINSSCGRRCSGLSKARQRKRKGVRVG